MRAWTLVALVTALAAPGCAAEDKTEAEYVFGCEDGDDNDGDQLFDCVDPDCFQSPVCRNWTPPGQGGGDSGDAGDSGADGGACDRLEACCVELAGAVAQSCQDAVDQTQTLAGPAAEIACQTALDALQDGGQCLTP